PTDRAGLWLLTNQGRDRYALVRLDLATGITAVAHEHAVVDVETAGVSTLTGQPLFAIAHPDYPESRVFDATLSSDLAPLGEPGPAEVRILSFDDAERLATVRVSRDRGREHHLLDRRTGTRTLLSRSAMAPYADRLARVEPISLTSRDGLTLRGYLTRPPGARARVPMVLLVHGGPWTRDYWGYNGTVQFLASRGWAVLQLNYRASTGYGRAFVDAGVRQHAGAVPEDRQRLEAQSPLFRAADVRRPVLVIHGANDPNVKQRESNQMVAALRAAGKDVQYLVLADEGHGAFGDPASALRMYRAIEQFL